MCAELIVTLCLTRGILERLVSEPGCDATFVLARVRYRWAPPIIDTAQQLGGGAIRRTCIVSLECTYTRDAAFFLLFLLLFFSLFFVSFPFS